jgi:RNA polymerase sigma factor (sigma-70 family)
VDRGERPTADLPDAVAPDETSGVDDADAMVRALERLGHHQRAAVVLRYYARLTEEQMATVLGVAPGTVKSRLARALAALAADRALGDLRGAP